MAIVPPNLKKGDTIGVICPSGSMPLDKMQTCLHTLEQWGFKVKKGRTLGTQFQYFSGTDEERREDVQTMLDDNSVNAILCARGGYGLSRIIDNIDFSTFIAKPKWIVGYSDVTLLHSHLFQNYHIASLHSPMAAAFNNGGSTSPYVQSLLKILLGEASSYSFASNKRNKPGVATGELVGGNLCLLAHLIGSKSSMDTTGKILFIEDVGEYIYSVDRILMQLKRAGMLDSLAGLLVGSFTGMKDTTIPFGQSVYDAVYDKVKEYTYPVAFHFPAGHAEENYALKHGVLHRLEVAQNGVRLTEKN